MRRKPESQRLKPSELLKGCLFLPFWLLWQFIKWALVWGIIIVIVVGFLYITGYYDRMNEEAARERQRVKSATEIQSEMEQQMLEDAYDGLTGWDWID